MFSKSCEYAIRAVIFIGLRSGNGAKTGVKEIAEEIDSPVHFIAKILQELGKQGLVQSVKGPNGGFYLDAATMKRSLADVVRAIDGDAIFSGCALGLKQCSETKPCPLHNSFKALRNNLKEMLENATLGAFTEQLEERLVFLRRDEPTINRSR